MVNYQKTEEAFKTADYYKYEHDGTITPIKKRKDGIVAKSDIIGST